MSDIEGSCEGSSAGVWETKPSFQMPPGPVCAGLVQFKTRTAIPKPPAMAAVPRRCVDFRGEGEWSQSHPTIRSRTIQVQPA